MTMSAGSTPSSAATERMNASRSASRNVSGVKPVSESAEPMEGGGASSGATLPVSGTVLLHGGEGVGKFTLVARAAATLGLHLVTVEGAELALKGLREAEDSLRDTANAAAAAAPVGEW